MKRGIKEDLGADWRISAISETRNGLETSNIWGKWRRRISVQSETFSPPVTALLNIERWKWPLCLGTTYVGCVTVEHRLFPVWNFTLHRSEVSPKLSCIFKSFLEKRAYGTHWIISWSGDRAGLSWWLGKTVWYRIFALQSIVGSFGTDLCMYSKENCRFYVFTATFYIRNVM
jgi:hypothetical protein